MKIILSGYGAMNRLVANIAEEKGHEIVGVYSPNNQNDYPALSSLHGQDADLVIDFSHPDHLLGVLEKQLELPIVVATTGQKDKIIKKLEEQSKQIPVFFSANMSYGVHALTKILEAALPLLESYDIELIEAHHNKKVDAPSGTLVQLLETVTSYHEKAEPVYDRHDKSAKRDENEIGIHTLRAGSIVGDHEVLFAGEDESIQLIHKAGSKSIFARGAIKAGEKLIEKSPGFYTFNQL